MNNQTTPGSMPARAQSAALERTILLTEEKIKSDASWLREQVRENTGKRLGEQAALQIVSRFYNFENWQTLSAALKSGAPVAKPKAKLATKNESQFTPDAFRIGYDYFKRTKISSYESTIDSMIPFEALFNEQLFTEHMVFFEKRYRTHLAPLTGFDLHRLLEPYGFIVDTKVLLKVLAKQYRAAGYDHVDENEIAPIINDLIASGRLFYSRPYEEEMFNLPESMHSLFLELIPKVRGKRKPQNYKLALASETVEEYVNKTEKQILLQSYPIVWLNPDPTSPAFTYQAFAQTPLGTFNCGGAFNIGGKHLHLWAKLITNVFCKVRDETGLLTEEDWDRADAMKVSDVLGQATEECSARLGILIDRRMRFRSSGRLGFGNFDLVVKGSFDLEALLKLLFSEELLELACASVPSLRETPKSIQGNAWVTGYTQCHYSVACAMAFLLNHWDEFAQEDTTMLLRWHKNETIFEIKPKEVFRDPRTARKDMEKLLSESISKPRVARTVEEVYGRPDAYNPKEFNVLSVSMDLFQRLKNDDINRDFAASLLGPNNSLLSRSKPD